jgi:magnesium transporter
MLYVSELIGKPIQDQQGKALARVRDVVIHLPDATEREAGRTVPQLHGLLAETGRRGPGFLMPLERLDRLGAGPVVVNAGDLNRDPYHRGATELLARKQMWDRRVIATETPQVRRINDVVLAPPDADDTPEPPAAGYLAANLVLRGVDIGPDGLVRRLGLYGLLAGPLRRWLHPRILPWDAMELVAVGLLGDEVRHADLGKLHPAELAELTQSVSTREAAELIGALDDGLAADVMEELPIDRQIDIVEFLPDTRAADILEEMAPDDASDLLGDLPDERTSALLEKMQPDVVSDVRELLQYPDTTAGGMMTNQYVSVPQHLTVEETIARLRAEPELHRANMVYYVYVTAQEDDDQLVGVLSLRELLLADPEDKIADIMLRDFLTARPHDADDEVARTMGEYNLLGLPVVDDKGRILGIVTVDDALDVLLPAGWQRRLPRVFS